MVNLSFLPSGSTDPRACRIEATSVGCRFRKPRGFHEKGSLRKKKRRRNEHNGDANVRDWTAVRSAEIGVRGGMRVRGMLGMEREPRDDKPKLGDYFGFLPLEIYKLDNRIGNLVLADLDGDKVLDLIVANNSRSRIDLLLSRKNEAGSDAAKEDSTEANQVPSDLRLRLKSLPVNKEVVSVQAGDFNDDGKADIAFYGTPAELTILYNQGNGKFGDPRKINVGDAIEAQRALTVGDLNRDGRDDLALITTEEVVIVLQTKDGKFADPERTSHTLTKPGMIKAVDLDGDGGADLVMLDNADSMPIRARFSTADGRLGPEQRFKIEPLRAYNFANMDGKPGSELLTVEMQSGRARIYALEEGADDESIAKRGRLIFHPLPRGLCAVGNWRWETSTATRKSTWSSPIQVAHKSLFTSKASRAWAWVRC